MPFSLASETQWNQEEEASSSSLPCALRVPSDHMENFPAGKEELFAKPIPTSLCLQSQQREVDLELRSNMPKKLA